MSASDAVRRRTVNLVADDSKATDVGVRYAQALFELAKDQREGAAVEADLRSLKAMRADSEDLRTLIGWADG